jgi:MbtH protein
MISPFDAEDRSHLVLADDEGQHSLWPADIDVPAGWGCVLGPAARRTCPDLIERRWRDLRPRRSRTVPVRHDD